jgi:hypothetical protein
VDIPLLDQPLWLLGFPVGMSSIWVAVLADGQIQAFLLTDDIFESIPVESHSQSVVSPPALGLINDAIQLMKPPTPYGSPFTHPILLNSPSLSFASVNIDGHLVLWEHDKITQLLVDALPDGRILLDEMDRILILTNPSTQYAHGVLGDAVEATGIALVETQPCPRVVTTISIPSPSVIEGLSPIWTDLDGDGSREILITLSNATEGARFVVYTENGERRAAGPPVGRGYRWRHQLAVAPFGPNGEMEIASVLTPHIGGIVEFYRLMGEELEIVARVPGYSTHMLGSRNLDMALAGDLDADGRIELLVPNQQFNALGAIRRITNGVEVTWSLPVGGRISTNITAVRFDDDIIALGVGHIGRILRIWIP